MIFSLKNPSQDEAVDGIVDGRNEAGRFGNL